MRTDIAYPSVFVMRALCAVLIVLAHSTLPYKDLVMPAVRIAVPLFFMMSGYFIWSPSHAGIQDKAIRKLKKIGWLILYANAVYIVLAVAMHLLDPACELPLNTPKSWFLLLFFGTGVALPLWYLTAYFETLLILLIALRFRKEDTLIRFAPLLLIVNIAIGMYGSLFGLNNVPYSLKVNFLMEGIPFFCVGYAIQEYLPQITEKLTPKRSSWLLAGISALAFCEMAFIRRYMAGADLDYTNTVYITTLPLAATVFIWCLLHPDIGNKSLLEKLGRNYSLDIYLWHFIFFLILFTFFRNPFITRYSFLVVLPCSVLLAILHAKIHKWFFK